MKCDCRYLIALLDIVVPRVGTWVEIYCIALPEQALQSSPAWGRGLKYQGNGVTWKAITVVPRVGTWVEMLCWPCPRKTGRRSSPAWGRGLKFAHDFHTHAT